MTTAFALIDSNKTQLFNFQFLSFKLFQLFSGHSTDRIHLDGESSPGIGKRKPDVGRVPARGSTVPPRSGPVSIPRMLAPKYRRQKAQTDSSNYALDRVTLRGRNCASKQPKLRLKCVIKLKISTIKIDVTQRDKGVSQFMLKMSKNCATKFTMKRTPKRIIFRRCRRSTLF